MARRLLDQGHEVLTLTNSTRRSNPFGEKVKAQPFNFSNPALLEETLRGVNVLINNYWVRFDLPPLFTHAGAVLHAKTLFEAAKRAGVARIVHISITNPDRHSSLPYFSGKAEMENHLDGIISLHPATDRTVWQRGYLDQQRRLVLETPPCLRHFW
jgi:NADH dehydrogenase